MDAKSICTTALFKTLINTMKKYTFTGTMYNRYEIIKDGEGNAVKTVHIGMDDGGSGEFGKTLTTIVPEIGDTQTVRITFEVLSKENKDKKSKK